MKKTLVVYASKYGSTEEAARMMGLILGPAQVVRAEAFIEKHRDFDFVVLVTPIYAGKLYLETFMEENEAWLAGKPLALVCVALDEKDGLRALNGWKQRLGEAAQLSAWLGGRLDLGSVDQDDRSALEAFARMTGYQLQNRDAFDPEQIIALALQIKEIRDRSQIDMPETEIKRAVEEFLQSHNTCALCTSRPGHVRSRLPVQMNVIRICLEKAEFLWSGFQKQGYAVRQTCSF